MNCSTFLRAFCSLALLVLVLANFLSVARGDAVTDEAEGWEFFERNIRPLLAEKCFSCHGRGQTKGELSLDSLAGIMAGGESGPAVVTGNPEESLLIAAIQYEGGIEMPPDMKLSDRNIDLLRQWVAMGAPWPEEDPSEAAPIREDGSITERDRHFWSFQPIRQPPLPTVNRGDWPRQPLDYFVLSRLEAEGLDPVPEVDRRTYIRRVSFDLIGLPPTAAEITEFVADERSDAYERLIDRLLGSPQYGERWARHWLDIARYGEDQAHTFQARRYPSGYRYRDWVIASLNQDMPIDQFFLEQIAGDLLPGDDRMGRLPALGYFALGPVYYADAGCAPKAKADEYDDRIDTLTRGMLGLTVACARCHDHKFDPISAQDYYALAGVFASTDYVEAPLAPAEVVATYDAAQQAIQRAEKEFQEAQAKATRQFGESLASYTAQYLAVVWEAVSQRGEDAETRVALSLAGTTLKGSEVHDLIAKRWDRFLRSESAKQLPVLAPWHVLLATLEQADNPATETSAREQIASVAEAIQTQLLAAIEARRESEMAYRLQLAQRSDEGPPLERPELPSETAELLKQLVDHRDAPLALPADRWETLLPEAARETLAERKRSIESLKEAAPAKYPVAHSLTDGTPTDSKVQLRGNVNDLGDEVPRRFLTILSPDDAEPFREGSGRLELAQAIIHPENPLTARVFVNRVWQHHFGRGIVGTPSNFGLLGERPTHPELLNYLAARFIASGWSLKRLHRDIMLSATYRRASADDKDNYDRDPDNRLLWRMNRRRLDVESWRDAMLKVAGHLEVRLGGPSVDLHAEANTRRTLYAAVSRHDLNPVLRLFDFPDPNLTSERRSQTTVPMQQLFVLNSEFMVSQARALVARLEQEELSDDAARIDQLYGWVFGRSPGEQEQRLGLDFVGVSHVSLGDGEVSSTGDLPLSRWEQYAQALLGTNEFFFVD